MEISEFMALDAIERRQRLLEWQIKIAWLLTVGTGQAISWEQFQTEESWRWDPGELKRRVEGEEISDGND